MIESIIRISSLATVVMLASAICLDAQRSTWPVLKRYDQQHLDRIAMPVGGVGTGDIALGGNGEWKEVEIMNKPGMDFFGSVTPKRAPSFIVFVKDASGNKMTRALMGPVASYEYEGWEGSHASNHGLPRFSTASFEVAYPFGTVNLDDPAMPVTCKARAFNPFVPADADASGIPIAIIRYEIRNKTNSPLTVSVAGVMDNFVGMDGSNLEFDSFTRTVFPVGTKKNINTFQESGNLKGIYMSSDSVNHDASAWGTIALTTAEPGTVTYRTQFDPKGWNSNVNDMWDDISDDGQFTERHFQEKVDSPGAGLSIEFELAAGATREVQFLLTWNFPNRKDWTDKVTVGNYYSTKYLNAWDVAEKTLPRISELEARTVDFVNLIVKSDYPEVIKEAALFNSSTLHTQTAFRLKDGNFFGWEGVFNSTGSCYGSCTHVWNYEETTPFLFGELAKSMRRVEYLHALNDTTGLMSFRVSLPFDKTKNWKAAAADGQMGTIMKVYRDWQLSGDDAFLHEVWPGVKKALSFAWIAGGWDADKDGVMEGCQHNTMDIEYFGPNPEIEFWYLGALKAAAAMAHHLKEKSFEETCNKLFQQGSTWTDQNLFNGDFYIHKIQPMPELSAIASGTIIGMGAKNLKDPEFQIGEGCLVDQLVGQNMAHICGLGYLAKPENIKKTMESIWKYNHVKAFGTKFNNMRTYVLGDESGLMITAYPDPSRRPRIPLSYYSEAWTGLEYTAASGMIYEGINDIAINVMNDVRARYDGKKRNPFNEAECGNHYARAMAAWSTMLAFSQFNYSAVEAHLTITSKPGTYFWSNGYAWGDIVVRDGGAGPRKLKAEINVHFGALRLQNVTLKQAGDKKFKQAITVGEGKSLSVEI